MGNPPVDPLSPPSYQMSIDDFDHKVSQAVQLSSSSMYQVDEEGWPVYDQAAFEAAHENYDPSPPSSSAGILGAANTSLERQGRSSDVKAPASTRPMKTRSSERRRRNPRPDDEYASEHRAVTPPPPFTPTGPSLDGPPFEDVVLMSYDGSDSQAGSPLEPSYPPPPSSPPPLPPPQMQLPPPVEPLRVSTRRVSDPQMHNLSNPYPPRRPSPMDVRPKPSPTSTITRVEFDPQMAYSPYGCMGNHTSLQTGASAFYNHAVASQLATGSTTIAPTPSNYRESRISSPYSSGYSPTSHPAQPVSSSVSLNDQYSQHLQGFHFNPSVPLPPPHQSYPALSHAGVGHRVPSGSGRGPLPPLPGSHASLSHARWEGSDAQLVQDPYGGHG
ncbi:hypothetical protein F5148DRAFT_1156948 [Russula earlei]|uniref:Uncharacterized protein n=1 Tax=Russula earlei TaxID=71964 RepID=A0ACC0UNN9_9AGAM|nr:hypothetical protein F5148DRAFT_1156948 [Russula earlei]